MDFFCPLSPAKPISNISNPIFNVISYLFYERTSLRIRMFMAIYDESLHDVIQKQRKLKKNFTVAQIKFCITHIINGIHFLHGYYIIHRDIKSGNVFIHNDVQGEIQHLVIADYDTAIQMDTPSSLIHETIGTPGWMAAEVLNSKETGYNLSADSN